MSQSIAIIGASGYTGAELIRLIATHPSMKINALAANSKAGQTIAEVFPHLRHLELPVLTKWDEIDFTQIDLCFCALPHKTSQEVISQLPKSMKIVDLSADFRLRDPAAYKQWYGNDHAAPDLQEEAVYGLTEMYRDQIAMARLVAGTGCNAATGQYVLSPLLKAGVIDPGNIVMDLICGVTGAGRALKEPLLHGEMSEGTHPYALGSTHRHMGEFDQELAPLSPGFQMRFTPHLAPFNRGILATTYVKGDAASIYQAYQTAYSDEPFLTLLPLGETPSTHHVRGSNFCHIGVVQDRTPGYVTVVAALDNLCKGSSGQALQNANLMLGLPETSGLMLAPCFP